MTNPADMWETRYGDSAEYVYGTEPNDHLVEAVANIPVGRALCIADGEGRNGVYLASLGHEVTSIDLTEAGMAKARRLAAERNVPLSTVVTDVADYDLGTEQWDLIVSIFAHMPPPIRQPLHGRIARALKPGGTFILEAYTPDQIGRGTGGPPVPGAHDDARGASQRARRSDDRGRPGAGSLGRRRPRSHWRRRGRASRRTA